MHKLSTYHNQERRYLYKCMYNWNRTRSHHHSSVERIWRSNGKTVWILLWPEHANDPICKQQFPVPGWNAPTVSFSKFEQGVQQFEQFYHARGSIVEIVETTCKYNNTLSSKLVSGILPWHVKSFLPNHHDVWRGLSTDFWFFVFTYIPKTLTSYHQRLESHHQFPKSNTYPA